MGGFGVSVEDDEKTPLVDGEKRSTGVNEQTELEQTAWQYKAVAFVCSCLISVGSHFAAQMLSALKSTLIEELGITNAQYGILQSTVSLVNTVTPFFGGIFIDKLGTGPGSLLFSSMILLGDVIVATSTHLGSFPLMVAGRMVYGIGSGCIVTVQEAILAHWFKGKALAVTIGFQIAISRLSSLLATGTVVPISEATGFYGNAFWVSSGICFFSWLCNIAYLYVLWRMGEQRKKDLKTLEDKMKKKSTFKLSAVYSFPHLFWLITFMSFALGMCWGPYLHISPDLIKHNFGREDEEAAWESTYSMIIPVVVSPFLGYMIDRWGKRSLLAFVSGALLVISFCLLGFTMIDPILGLLVFSFSYTFGPVALISSIPLLLDVSIVGTALGIYKCASNIGSGLVDPIIGVVQDRFDSYDQVMMILASCAGVATLGGIILLLVDHLKHKGLLDMTRKRREEAFQTMTADEIAPKATRCPTILYLLTTAVLLIACWTVYISLVIMVYVKEEEEGGGGGN